MRGDFSSMGKFDFVQAFHPPFRIATWLYPLDNSFCAKLALVCSLGHAQYKTRALSLGKSLAHELNFLGNRLMAPFILTSLDFQSPLVRTSMITTAGLSSMPLSWSIDMMETSEAAAGKKPKRIKTIAGNTSIPCHLGYEIRILLHNIDLLMIICNCILIAYMSHCIHIFLIT